MPNVRDRLFFIESFEEPRLFRADSNSVYIIGDSNEPRSSHPAQWRAQSDGVEYIHITDVTAYSFIVNVKGAPTTINLRSHRSLQIFWSHCFQAPVYLDITGIAHHVWAPLLRSGLQGGIDLRLVYVEPEHYKFSQTPTEGEIFDLSERISGVAPLPGFATFGDAGDENICFVPLLGFEGIRFAHILEHVQPPSSKIVPVVGVPGFKPEYPFHTYQGNRRTLLETRGWKNVRYASANNPFSLFFALEEIAATYSRDRLKVAPIGTKPHAVGAVLYAIASPKPVELVYDHPIRKPERTEGSGKLFVYDVATFACT